MALTSFLQRRPSSRLHPSNKHTSRSTLQGVLTLYFPFTLFSLRQVLTYASEGRWLSQPLTTLTIFALTRLAQEWLQSTGSHRSMSDRTSSSTNLQPKSAAQPSTILRLGGKKWDTALTEYGTH